jgi:alpha-glucosidase
VEPWLPYGDVAACNIAAQRHDPSSTLSLTRDLISLRDAIPDIRRGASVPVEPVPDGLWAWRRGERVLVAVNLGDAEATLTEVAGTIRIGTDRARDNERVDGTLMLRLNDGVVIWLDPRHPEPRARQ